MKMGNQFSERQNGELIDIILWVSESLGKHASNHSLEYSIQELAESLTEFNTKVVDLESGDVSRRIIVALGQIGEHSAEKCQIIATTEICLALRLIGGDTAEKNYAGSSVSINYLRSIGDSGLNRKSLEILEEVILDLNVVGEKASDSQEKNTVDNSIYGLIEIGEQVTEKGWIRLIIQVIESLAEIGTRTSNHPELLTQTKSISEALCHLINSNDTRLPEGFEKDRIRDRVNEFFTNAEKQGIKDIIGKIAEAKKILGTRSN